VDFAFSKRFNTGKKMNLYLFNANDSAATYGIGTYLNELTFALRDSGISVHIVHLHSLRPEFEIEVRQPRKPVAWQGSAENRVEDWYIPEVRNNNTFSGSVQKLEDYYRNVVYLLRLNIKDTKDLIFHFNYNQSHVLAKELKAMFDCKTVAVIHYSKWMFEFQGNLQKLHELKAKPESQRTSFEQLLYTTDKYESRLYRETDRVIVLSQHMKHILESEYQLHIDKISVISNGLSDKGSFRINGRKSLRKKWRISDKEFIILFVGRLQPVKGLIFLMRAFRKVLAKYPDCRLMIAGNGSYDTYMQETKDICTKISFTGLLDRQALSEI
jgi:glycosyltransferase involved in cell wall biosynthesis